MSAIKASTAAIDTPQRAAKSVAFPVAGGATLYAGSLIALNSSGYAISAGDLASITVIGRAENTADNSAGSDGDITVTVKKGVFRFLNSTDHPVSLANRGQICFVESNQAVATTGSNLAVAGRVVDVDSDGVWVDTTSAQILSTIPAVISRARRHRSYLLRRAFKPDQDHAERARRRAFLVRGCLTLPL